MSLLSANDLWRSVDEAAWTRALAHYWKAVPKSREPLEREMNALTPAVIAAMTPEEWRAFLDEKYLKWKHREYLPRRRRELAEYVRDRGLAGLDSVRRRILEEENAGLGDRLATVMSIKGFGTAAASGLLALMYPTVFGTVDKFVVLALRTVTDLPDLEIVQGMTPGALNRSDGIQLVRIFQRKAAELNAMFGATHWTPRRIDMTFWAIDRDRSA